MNRIGKQLLQDSKAAILADGGGIGKLEEKSSWPGRDLLSLLLRANMSTDLPPNQRMTEEDVLAREYPRSCSSLVSITEWPCSWQRSLHFWLLDTKPQGLN